MPPKDPRFPDNPFTPRHNPTPSPSGGGPRGGKFAKLDALFKGGGAPPPSTGAPHRPPPGSGMGPKMRIERLRAANTPDELMAACDALLRNNDVPDEPELLIKMMQHPDAAVGERALAGLGALQRAGKLDVTVRLREALDAFEPRCKEPLARNLLKELRGDR